MHFSEIKKNPLQASDHNLVSYDDTYQHFNWQIADARLSGHDKKLNIAFEAVDRHVDEGFGEQVAIRWLSKQGEQTNISYAHLKAQSNRFANILQDLGVQPSETVFALSTRVPQLYIALLERLNLPPFFHHCFLHLAPSPYAHVWKLVMHVFWSLAKHFIEKKCKHGATS
ncbi:AMP-binding protein [Psychromonas sp. MME1]|uniref:AMP-binding protein n=1 Tax=Psychromonas sp. MME1 TaxID=3231032 RepID=UPI0034E22D68